MSDPTQTPSRESTQVKITEAKVGIFVKVVAGFLFIIVGIVAAYLGMENEEHFFVWLGIGVAVFGAWLLPTLGDQITKIYVTVFPNGIPFLGGRRAGDPPAPPPSAGDGK